MHLSNVLQLETVLATCSCCSYVYLCCQVVALLEIPYIFSFYRCTIFYIYSYVYNIYKHLYIYMYTVCIFNNTPYCLFYICICKYIYSELAL